MSKTYRELLLDPRWQRKRLEVLESAGWQCEICSDEESTLHVHHLRYVKGRKPWEYERGEPKALCAECHKGFHATKDLLEDLLVKVEPYRLEEIVALVGGFLHGTHDTTEEQDAACQNMDPLAWQAGILASIGGGSSMFQLEIAQLCQRFFPPQCFIPNQKAAFDRAVKFAAAEDGAEG